MRGLAIVRGGGDLATGVIYRLWRSHYRILCLETEHPLVVRRPVSVAEAIFSGRHTIEGMTAVRRESPLDPCDPHDVAVVVDPQGECIDLLSPDLVVDAIMAKRNLGTHRDMAPLVLAIGPGFTAPDDVDGVVETKRGHFLGRLITKGSAIPNTGVPGMEMGYTVERLLRAPCDGFVRPLRAIGDSIACGDVIAEVEGEPVKARIDGVLRGLIHPSVRAEQGLKIGDIDPRNEHSHCFSITDKALAIGGGILEGVMSHENRRQLMYLVS